MSADVLFFMEIVEVGGDPESMGITVEGILGIGIIQMEFDDLDPETG